MNSRLKIPWIEENGTGQGEILEISRHHRQLMCNRSGTDHGVRLGKFFRRGDSAPNICLLCPEIENSGGILNRYLLQPKFKTASPDWVHQSLSFDSPSDFTKRNNTEIESAIPMMVPPRHYGGICFASLHQFADHVSIQQKSRFIHDSSKVSGALLSGRLLRGSFRSNSHASSSSKTGALSKWSANARFNSSSWFLVCSEVAKIWRCSSSAEIPCAAARVFKARTMSSSRFLTSNCAMLALIAPFPHPVNFPCSTN